MQNYGIFTEMGESHRSLNRAIDAESQDIASKMGLFVQNRSVLFSLGPFLIAGYRCLSTTWVSLSTACGIE